MAGERREKRESSIIPYSLPGEYFQADVIKREYAPCGAQQRLYLSPFISRFISLSLPVFNFTLTQKGVVRRAREGRLSSTRSLAQGSLLRHSSPFENEIAELMAREGSYSRNSRRLDATERRRLRSPSLCTSGRLSAHRSQLSSGTSSFPRLSLAER